MGTSISAILAETYLRNMEHTTNKTLNRRMLRYAADTLVTCDQNKNTIQTLKEFDYNHP
jgi:hypothetical protein